MQCDLNKLNLVAFSMEIFSFHGLFLCIFSELFLKCLATRMIESKVAKYRFKGVTSYSKFYSSNNCIFTNYKKFQEILWQQQLHQFNLYV